MRSFGRKVLLIEDEASASARKMLWFWNDEAFSWTCLSVSAARQLVSAISRY